MLGRLEEGLSHLKTAERLMPGSLMMWILKMWEARALAQFGRWADADAAVDEVFNLNPAYTHGHVLKALVDVNLGRESEARMHMETARQLGLALASAEHLYRLVARTSPTLDADIAVIRALYARAIGWDMLRAPLAAKFRPTPEMLDECRAAGRLLAERAAAAQTANTA